jgi:hypothetical protein
LPLFVRSKEPKPILPLEVGRRRELAVRSKLSAVDERDRDKLDVGEGGGRD